MLELNSRDVLYYEFIISPSASNRKIDLRDSFKRIEKTAFICGNAKLVVNNNSACVRIQDLYIDEYRSSINALVNYTDEKLSNPALQNIITPDIEIIQKKENQGVASSIHIVMSYIPKIDNHYIGLVEQIPGFPKHIYMKLFNYLFRLYCTDIVGNGLDKKVKCHPKIESNILDGDALDAALKKHPLKGITLYRYDKTKSDIDENDEVSIFEQTVFLKPRELSLGEKAKEIIKKCAAVGREKQYSALKVHFATDDNREKTIRVETTKADSTELYFGKRKKINLRNYIDQCSEFFHKELLQSMNDLLAEEMK